MIGHGFQAAPVHTVRFWKDYMINLLGWEFDKHTFIDVGAGNGAVMAVWAESPGPFAVKGIEADPELAAEAARVNRDTRRWGTQVVIADARTFKIPHSWMPPFIWWMYNPFGLEDTLTWSHTVKGEPGFLLYCNPQHVVELAADGWMPVSDGVVPDRREESVVLLKRGQW